MPGKPTFSKLLLLKFGYKGQIGTDSHPTCLLLPLQCGTKSDIQEKAISGDKDFR
jgi:hypothetical protein